MAAKEVKKATTNLNCPVCYQVFKNPKYLPCYHSYCEECLEKMVKQSKITCPECRQEATVPAGGVTVLANNFLINRLVDELILKRKVDGEEEVRCENCDEDDPVVAFCPDCSVFLCHLCNEAHKCAKVSRGHGIVPLTELRSNKDVIQPKAKTKVPLCKKHEIELMFYCETCEELVCMYCTVKDHAGHEHDTVKLMAGKHRSELQKITVPVEEMIGHFSMVQNTIKESKKKNKDHGDAVNKKIDQHCEEIIQRVLNQKDQLKQQVKNSILQNEKELESQLEAAKCMQAETLNMKELKDALEQSSDQEALFVKEQVIDQMQRLTEKYKKSSFRSFPFATVRYVPNREFISQFGHLRTPEYFAKISKPCKVVSNDGTMGNPWGIAISSKGMWAVADSSNHCVYLMTIDQDQLIVKFGGYGTNDGLFSHPDGLAFDDDHLFVVDRDNHRVQKFDVNGKFLLKFGTKGITDGQLHKPRVFQVNGQFQCIIGKGVLGTPYNVALDTKNRLLVTDHGKGCIFSFNLAGRYLGKFSNTTMVPLGIATDSTGLVFVTSQNEILIFEVHIHHFSGSDDGQFNHLCTIAIASNGLLYITDYDNCRVQIF